MKGASIDTCLAATPKVVSTSSADISRRSANSSEDGSLSYSCSSSENALLILFREPTLLSGSLTILDCSASAWRIDCLIHHTA